jgi:hypothetical protein
MFRVIGRGLVVSLICFSFLWLSGINYGIVLNLSTSGFYDEEFCEMKE